jgi:3'(2'), 5'-bisphosphate nucleotidase
MAVHLFASIIIIEINCLNVTFAYSANFLLINKPCGNNNLIKIVLKLNPEIYITALNAAIAAGDAIMKVYSQKFEVELKTDGSPLTLADKKANDIIFDELAGNGIPVISEEKPIPPFEERKKFAHFWLIDPLDGTKEFIKRNGEFTVNIALIRNNYPVFGVLTAPALNYGYIGTAEYGAYKINDLTTVNDVLKTCGSDFQNLVKSFEQLHPVVPDNQQVIVSSRSHSNEGNNEIINKLFKDPDTLKTIKAGSALKFGFLAEGKAHFYLRNDCINEWDTAAGHALLNAAGGLLLTWPSGGQMLYNKEKMRNPGFVACATKEALKLLKAKFTL